jgi:hypothetical protein
MIRGLISARNNGELAGSAGGVHDSGLTFGFPCLFLFAGGGDKCR